MSWFRFDRYDADARRSLADAFATAEPFPHIVLDDLLDVPPGDVVPAFPAPDWDGWQKFRDSYQAGKMYCQDIDAIPDPFASMIHELSEPTALEFLETITGVDGLLPDPHLEGAGLHCSQPGGVLAPHTDFHLYARLGVFRQINLLLYLNEDWPEDGGGGLELWRKGAARPEKVVAPIYGRCVIFRTNDRSVHGFSQPVHSVRRSIALYYYTAHELKEFGGDNNVYWQHHGEHPLMARTQLAAYRGLLFGSRALSRLAHRVNPNIRASWRRDDG